MKNGKKFLFGISLLSAGVLSLALTACNEEKPNDSKTDTVVPSESVNDKVKVTFKNGDTVLHEESVKKGEKVAAWTPTGITDEFFGWYGEPTLKHEFDFNNPINADTVVFGKFVGYQKDERKWGLAGSGASSLLKESNWGKVFTEAHYMTNESTDKKNVFKMTLNLFKDDQFQFTNPQIDGTSVAWGHQRGAGYLKEPTKNGVEYFSLGNSLNDDNYTANITVAKDGKYEFTLTTYPKGDFQKEGTELYNNRSYYDTITYEYLGECEEERAEVEVSYYLKGAKITGWGDFQNANTLMSVKDGVAKLENVYLVSTDEFMFATKNKDVATGDITDGNIYIKATNLDEASKALVGGESNMKVKADGYYTFSYNIETTKLTVTKNDSFTPLPGEYFIDGSFCEWGGCGNNTYKLAKSAADENIYTTTVTLKADDEIGLQYFDVNAGEGKGWNGFFSAKNMVANENFDLTANNAKCKVAGTYKVEFNTYSHVLTLTLVTE